MNINYAPAPTIRAWMRSNALVKILVGPLGSGKSTGAIHELFRRACEQAPDPNGVRRTRYAIVRNTLKQMSTTVLPDVRAYLGNLADWRVSESTIYVRFKLDDGTFVNSEWMLIPLENPEDVRRLLSTQLTAVWIEECREVEYSFLQPALGRVGRYPSMGVKPTWQALIGTTNPWPDGSPWYEAFETALPSGWELYRQPSGLSPQAENVENLPDGYYDRLCEGATEEFIKVSVHGLNGTDLSGSPVHGDAFSYEFHTAPSLSIIEGRVFQIGLDTDRNPAALIAQRGSMGELRVYREVFKEGTGLENFFGQELTPVMYEWFRGNASVICDPSAVRKGSVSEESQKEAIQRFGYDVVLAPTNNIEPRLRAVDNLLTTTRQGHPSLIIDRAGCPMLVRALRGEYKYGRTKRGELVPVPEKKHPISDVADALQYLALGFTAARMGRPIGVRNRGVQLARKPPPPAGAWT